MVTNSLAPDTLLNLVWLGISVAVLLLFTLGELRRRASRPASTVRRAIAVFFVAVALFPCVSASDDLFSFAFLQSHLEKHQGAGTTPVPPEDSQEKAHLHLARILQSLDHLQLSGLSALAVTFFCVAIVRLSRPMARAVSLLRRAGRAPPAVCFPFSR
jgi:hypothetical protein